MITEAAYTFGIGIAAIYRWLSRPKVEPTKVKIPRKKLD
jgi:transposase